MRKELARILDSSSVRIRKVQKVRDYFKEHQNEKKFYSEVYELATRELKEKGTVSEVLKALKAPRRILAREFALACIAAKQPLETPTEYLRRITGKPKKEPGRISPSIERYCSTNGGYKRGKNIQDGTH